MKKLLLPLVMSLVASQSQAALIYFDLIGTAGAGLLAGNEPGTIIGGSGGELANTTGITYDTDSHILDLTNVGWGSSQGFTDLSTTVSVQHIHVTTGANGNNGAGNFTATGGVIFNLAVVSTAATGSVFSNPVIDFDTATFSGTALTLAQREAQLFDGKMYINIHSGTRDGNGVLIPGTGNQGGEIRGFLVVPEPSTSLFGAIAIGALAIRRRRA